MCTLGLELIKVTCGSVRLLNCVASDCSSASRFLRNLQPGSPSPLDASAVKSDRRGAAGSGAVPSAIRGLAAVEGSSAALGSTCDFGAGHGRGVVALAAVPAAGEPAVHEGVDARDAAVEAAARTLLSPQTLAPRVVGVATTNTMFHEGVGAVSDRGAGAARPRTALRPWPCLLVRGVDVSVTA